MTQALATSRETRLGREVVVQVLDIEDVSRSRWEEVERLEAVARGEGTRGREVIRVNSSAASGDGTGNGNGEDEMMMMGQGDGGGQQQQQQQQQREAAGGGGGGGQGSGAGGPRNATHKLVVQDCKGQKMHAIELKRVDQLGVGTTLIGEKILLRAGTIVARGVVLLDPAQCVLWGGKVEAWHRAWVDGRMARLREAVGAGRRG
jgi:RecQ-mediated genome instability protein 1